MVSWVDEGNFESQRRLLSPVMWLNEEDVSVGMPH